MALINIDWKKKNILKIGNEVLYYSDSDKTDWRKKIEPWLTAVFQSEHLSLLLGSGFTLAINNIAKVKAQGMGRIKFKSFAKEIDKWSIESAKQMERGVPNFEDDIRSALELMQGLLIQGKKKQSDSLSKEINQHLTILIKNVLKAEYDFLQKDDLKAIGILKSFLISFGSRTATRERLQIFTTNYDRYIEYGCDLSVIYLLDRFIGKILPTFRASKIELDYHYNPPGIRGEPRYVEGVAKLTKLHGSIDWKFEQNQITKSHLPFGAEETHPAIPKNSTSSAVIYPNSSKGIETIYYPYSELFRDFASASCRPNSSIVTYGYGFGDSHINKIIEDMLTIPSTHLVIISYDSAARRIEK